MSNVTFTFAGTTITLECGEYRKDTRATGGRLGNARLIVTETGTHYVNRRGDVTYNLTDKAVIATHKTGINALMSSVAPMPNAITREVFSFTAEDVTDPYAAGEWDLTLAAKV